MSKEFQDECERLGLTGRQLIAKYKREGKHIEKGTYKKLSNKYTEKELLDKLIQFIKENRRLPIAADFVNNPGYPNFMTYVNRFGSWSNALKLVDLDVDSMVKKGVLNTSNQKGRLAEIKVINHFIQFPTDLAGDNHKSPFDGICPNGMNYEVKSSKLKEHNGSLYYEFHTRNKYKEEIEIYYFLAFNKDYTELMYAWRIPGEIVENDTFYVSLSSLYQKRESCAKFTIDNIKKYDITDKIKYIMIYNKKLYDGYIVAD
jgi:hypothetical protein